MMSTCSRLFWLGVPLVAVLLMGVAPCAAADEDAPAAKAKSPGKKAADAAKKADPYAVPDGTPEELLKFIDGLKDMRPNVKTQAEVLDHFRKAYSAALIAIDKIMAAKPNEEQEGQALVAKLQALWTLGNLGDAEKSEAAITLAGELIKDPRESVAAEARVFELIGRLRKLDPADADGAKSIVADTKALLEKDPDAQQMGQLAMVVAQTMEQAGQSELALAAYTDFASLLEKSKSAQAGQIAEQMTASAAKLGMVGKPLDITGTLVSGEEFDWAAYKGKVVLVDFWATWCGPCIAELPNVKQTYEKFHGLGFEVIGISLDDSDNRAGLEKFLADEQIAWPILFGTTAEESGWQHPMARKYNINAIPAAILLNREGNVVTLSARGEALPKLVEQLVGEPTPEPTDAEKPAEEASPLKKPVKKAPATDKPKSE
jgi:thiol-disulfide isomerase/thioredoxin